MSVGTGWTGAAVVCAQSSQPAAADPEAEYATLVSGALSEFEQGRWAQAREWFERAHALRPNARTLWGLGVTAFELGRYVQAIEELETALSDNRLALSEAQRGQAEDVIARAARHVARLAVELTPEQAELSLDGVRTTDCDLVLSPGLHTLAARAPGFSGRELSVHVAPGEKRALRLTLPPMALQIQSTPPAANTATTQAAPARDDGDGSVLESWWLWTAVAAVVAGGVTALVIVSEDGGDSGEPVDVRKAVLTWQP